MSRLVSGDAGADEGAFSWTWIFIGEQTMSAQATHPPVALMSNKCVDSSPSSGEGVPPGWGQGVPERSLLHVQFCNQGFLRRSS